MGRRNRRKIEIKHIPSKGLEDDKRILEESDAYDLENYDPLAYYEVRERLIKKGYTSEKIYELWEIFNGGFMSKKTDELEKQLIEMGFTKERLDELWEIFKETLKKKG